jgi:hypothetical protein
MHNTFNNGLNKDRREKREKESHQATFSTITKILYIQRTLIFVPKNSCLVKAITVVLSF